MQNPFKPTAGATPPELVGRAGLLDEFEYGLQQGSGAPGLLTIITGSRGIGKTVMLSEAEGIARNHGWAVISRTATPGFLAGVGDDMLRLLDELGDGPPSRKITAFSAAGFGLTTQLPPERAADWRRTGNELLRLLDAKGTGLVITIDEIHAVDRTEIAQLAADVQHFIRDGLPIGLIFAGLPSAVSDLLNEGVATFLRRADRINLHEAAIAEVTASYSELFGQGGISISPDLINEAAEATEGYPFLIQLVGYYLWLEADKAGWKLDQTAFSVESLPPNDGTPWWSSSQRCRTSRTETASSWTRWPPRMAPLPPARSAPSSRPSPTSCPNTGTGSSLRA